MIRVEFDSQKKTPAAVSIEQPSELNKVILLEWLQPELVRQHSAALLCPIYFITATWLVEAALLAGLNRENARPPSDQLIAGLIGSAALGVFLWGIWRFDTWQRKRAVRRLRADAKGFFLEPHKHGRVPWKQLLAAEFEPLPQRPGMTKLSIVTGLPGKPARQRVWPIVLESIPARENVLKHLRECLAAGNLREEQIVVRQDPPPPSPPPPVFNFWPGALAMLFIMHSLLLCLAPVALWDDGASVEEDRTRVQQEVQSKVGQLRKRGVPEEQITGLSQVLRTITGQTMGQTRLVVAIGMFAVGLALGAFAAVLWFWGDLINWRREMLWMLKHHPEKLIGNGRPPVYGTSPQHQS